MGSNKLAVNVDTEELIKLLDKAPKLSEEHDDKGAFFKNDVIDFINASRLKAGDQLVSSKLLYDMYQQWSKSKVGPNQFAMILQKYFPFEQKGRTFFYINYPAMEVTKKVATGHTKQQKREKLKYPKQKAQFEKFLKELDIKDGSYPVEAGKLLLLYDKWNYKTKKKLYISRNFFFNLCRLHLKEQKNNETRRKTYLVNSSIKQHLDMQGPINDEEEKS